MFYAYLFAFCKLVIAVVFAISLGSKLRDFSQFVKTIHNFRLLPSSLIPFSAGLILGSELLVVLLLFNWPLIAFLLGASLLLIFSGALAAVLVRKIQTPCHCFGASQQLVSPLDLVRNFGFLLCAGSGVWLARQSEFTLDLSLLPMSITCLGALVFVLIWTQLNEIYALFQPTLR